MRESRLIRAMQGKPLDRAPIWFMRQAGRYLPEYRAIRAKAGDFLSLCQSPHLASEVTYQPVERYHLDAAIIFSDILILPHAMGAPLQFIAGEGPCFSAPLRTQADVEGFGATTATYNYLGEAIERVKSRLSPETSLIGFCGSPWTVATYLIEGKGSKQFLEAKKMLYQTPDRLHLLLKKLTAASIDYLSHQVAAGADVLMIFDSWGQVLSPEDYLEFSLHYMAIIVKAIKDKFNMPVILFTKGAHFTLPNMAKTGCDVLGVDWTVPMDIARQWVGPEVCLQGNLDPSVLTGSQALISERIDKILKQSQSSQGRFIFNLGHGITPNIDPNQVDYFVKTVKSQSEQFYTACGFSS